MGGEPIQYGRCDVTKPLSDEMNAELRLSSTQLDLLIFSYVLLECSTDTNVASLALLRDLWNARPEVSHVLVLDAGQSKGKRRSSRDLAGSLRDVENLSNELHATAVRIEGSRRTEGVLLIRG